ILSHPWHSQQLPPIARHTLCHDASISFPVALPESLGDDEIQRLTQSLLGCISEHQGRCRVPELDAAVTICHDNGVWRPSDDLTVDLGLGHRDNFQLRPETPAANSFSPMPPPISNLSGTEHGPTGLWRGSSASQVRSNRCTVGSKSPLLTPL